MKSLTTGSSSQPSQNSANGGVGGSGGTASSVIHQQSSKSSKNRSGEISSTKTSAMPLVGKSKDKDKNEFDCKYQKCIKSISKVCIIVILLVCLTLSIALLIMTSGNGQRHPVFYASSKRLPFYPSAKSLNPIPPPFFPPRSFPFPSLASFLP